MRDDEWAKSPVSSPTSAKVYANTSWLRMNRLDVPLLLRPNKIFLVACVQTDDERA